MAKSGVPMGSPGCSCSGVGRAACPAFPAIAAGSGMPGGPVPCWGAGAAPCCRH